MALREVWLRRPVSAAAKEARKSKIRVLDIRPPHTETGLAGRAIAGVAPKIGVSGVLQLATPTRSHGHGRVIEVEDRRVVERPLDGIAWRDAIATDWRKMGSWRPGLQAVVCEDVQMMGYVD